MPDPKPKEKLPGGLEAPPLETSSKEVPEEEGKKPHRCGVLSVDMSSGTSVVVRMVCIYCATVFQKSFPLQFVDPEVTCGG